MKFISKFLLIFFISYLSSYSQIQLSEDKINVFILAGQSNMVGAANASNLTKLDIKDLENAHKYALDGFVKALLEVRDSLSMGLKSASDENATLEDTITGLELTNKVFNSTLEKFGVETLDPKDEKFNPELHEAVTMVPMPDKDSNTVLEVIQVGFTLNGRLVRPAMVIVVQ